MYLEIAPSRSGKTHRLLQAVYQNLRHLPQNYMVNIISTLAPEWITHELNKISNKINLNKIVISDNPVPGNEYLPYYDEFEILNTVEYHPNGYYCTSIHKPRTKEDIKQFCLGQRKDVLFSLIACNQNSVTTFDKNGERIQINRRMRGNSGTPLRHFKKYGVTGYDVGYDAISDEIAPLQELPKKNENNENLI